MTLYVYFYSEYHRTMTTPYHSIMTLTIHTVIHQKMNTYSSTSSRRRLGQSQRILSSDYRKKN